MKFSQLQKPLQDEVEFWVAGILENPDEANDAEIKACHDIQEAIKSDIDLSTEAITLIWIEAVNSETKNGSTDAFLKACNRFYLDAGLLENWVEPDAHLGGNSKPAIIDGKKYSWKGAEMGSPLDIAWYEVIGLADKD